MNNEIHPVSPTHTHNTPISVTGKDDGVTFSIQYVPIGTSMEKDVKYLSFQFHTPERSKEFVGLLARALSTSDPDLVPDWAMGLMDFISGTPSPKPRKVRA